MLLNQKQIINKLQLIQKRLNSAIQHQDHCGCYQTGFTKLVWVASVFVSLKSLSQFSAQFSEHEFVK